MKFQYLCLKKKLGDEQTEAMRWPFRRHHCQRGDAIEEWADSLERELWGKPTRQLHGRFLCYQSMAPI